MEQLELFEKEESELARRIRKVEEEIEREPEWIRKTAIWQGGVNIREGEHFTSDDSYSLECGEAYE